LKKKLLLMVSAEDDLLVDLTFRDVPANLLKEFAVQVVKPYYLGNLSEALKDLMRKAVADQEFVQSHTKPE
jgi:hypothetical protein